MAAYAALVSLMNNLEQVMNHPRLSTSLDKCQIESLGQQIGFLLDFVESYSSYGGVGKEEVEDLESQIASAAHATEDVIESHIVDQILPQSTLGHGETSSGFWPDLQKQIKAMKEKVMKAQEKILSKVDKSRQHQKVVLVGSTERSPNFLLDLQEIIEDMDSIKEKVMKFKEGREFKDQQPTYSVTASSSRPLTSGKNTMVGFDEELIQLMDMLTGQKSSRQIISIVGMGGIGKTTLARNIYENSLIMQHFDFRAWATISQEYIMTEVLKELLSSKGNSTSETVDELGERLYKNLSGRRYLIILDDMWSIEAWDKMKFFFPDNCNRSRVVITTRLSNVAIHSGSTCFRMNFLNEIKSWNLFCQKLFGQEECCPELVKIGKKIVEQCKGLPLSIVVIGGLLRKSNRTNGHWQNVAENINSILNSRENGQCLDVLYLSYSQLPAHLKPCFLYMGIFREDHVIRVSEIIKLWVAEGFVKPNGVQILEEIAEDYLNDLFDRNLILIYEHRSNGKIKFFHIHDLLRELCLMVAEKEKFFCVATVRSLPRRIDRERRVIFRYVFSSKDDRKVFKALKSASLARSLICEMVQAPVKCRLLRVLNEASDWSIEADSQNVNLRYFSYQLRRDSSSMIPSSISLIWNLQTLIVRGDYDQQIVAPLEIWKMPQLRHLKCSLIYLPDPPPSDEDQDDSFVLGNLQTLVNLENFRWSEEASKRIPNIKKLCMTFDGTRGSDDYLYENLHNLGYLQKLESLNLCFIWMPRISNNQLKNAFPSSLTKLSLTNSGIEWEDMTVIGSLPQLEVLKLAQNWVEGKEWNPVNGEFLRLKFLGIDKCDLTSWIADSSHFPVLEKLDLKELWDLNEIPWGIGEIPALQLIHLDRCSESAMISALKIKEEQEDMGNDGLQIQVEIYARQGKSFRQRVEIEGSSINNIRLIEY